MFWKGIKIVVYTTDMTLKEYDDVGGCICYRTIYGLSV